MAIITKSLKYCLISMLFALSDSTLLPCYTNEAYTGLKGVVSQNLAIAEFAKTSSPTALATVNKTKNAKNELFDEQTCINDDDYKNYSNTEKYNLSELCEEFFIDVAQAELLEIFIFSMATIIHELGHASAAKCLCGIDDPIEMHIGTRTPETSSRLFSLGNMHFYKTMPWTRGRMNIKQSILDCKNINSVCFMTAGGLSATAVMYLLLTTITGYCAHSDNKGLSEITLKNFVNGMSPFTYILNTKALSYEQKRLLLNAALVICLSLIYQIFYACTPYCNIGDGATVWRNYIGLKGTSLKIAHFLSNIGIWICWMLLIKKYCNARKKLLPQNTKIQIPAALITFLSMYYQLVPKE